MLIPNPFHRGVSWVLRAHAPLLALPVVVAALFNAPARGQGSSPFPAPLSSTDLARWTTALSLEGAARRAAEAAFERALAESQALRDGEMAAFARESVSPNDPQVSMEALEQRSRKAKAIAAQQAAIENRLFSEIAGLVTESQRTVVDAERRAAARRRSAATLQIFDRGGIVPDLMTLMPPALPEGESMETKAVLLDYDQRATELMQRLSSVAMETGPATRRARETQATDRPGAADDNPEAAARARMIASMKAREAAMAPLEAVRIDILALHRTTFERLMSMLPPERARALRRSFMQAHYGSISIKRDTPERLLKQVKALAEADNGVSPENVAAAERIIAAWGEQVDAIERRMMDAVDARRKEGRGSSMIFSAVGAGDDEGNTTFDDGLGELRRERDEATQRTRSEIASLAPALQSLAQKDQPGPQIAFAGPAEGGVAEMSGGAIMIMAMDDGPGEAIALDVTPDMLMRGGPALRTIDPREFDAMMTRLGWNGAARERARAAFDAYRGPADERLKTLMGKSPAPGAMELSGGGAISFMSVGEPMAPETVDAALAQLASDDDAFFSALGNADDAGLSRERAIRARDRLRQRLSLGAGPMLQPWGRFDKVELVAVVSQLPLTGDRRALVDSMTAAHGDRMTALLSQLAAAQAAVRKAETEMIQTIDHGDGRVERSISVRSGDEDLFMRAMRNHAEAVHAVNDEVRRTLAALQDQVPADTARKLRRAAYAQALPQIVTDPRSAEERVEQAIMLDSLSDESRRSLIELLAAHQDAVDALVDRFVDDSERAAREAKGPSTPGPEEMRSMRQSDGLRQRLQFDRNEVNEATMRRLRAKLSAEENRQVPDLAPAAGPRHGNFSFSF